MAEENTGEGSFNPIPLVIIGVVVLAVVLFVGFGKQQDYKPVVPGTKALDFTLPDLKGEMKSLSDYRGKVVFLNFWATWCKPCEDEMPSMEVLYRTYKDRAFVMLAVSIDKDGPEVIEAFKKEYPVSFEILHDRRGRTKEAYKTTGVPETFIIDQNGIIAEKIMGPRDWRVHANLATIMDLIENGPDPDGRY